MANYFDQFDPPAAAPKGGNFFDQYDPPAEPGVAEDVAKSLAIGVPKGVIGLAGLPGQASEWIGQGVNALGNLITGKNQSAEEFAAKRAKALGAADITAPTGETIQKGVEAVTGPLYEPKTLPGKYAQTVGEFVPTALAGPGGIARRVIAGAAVPGVTSEAGGQLTEGTPLEPVFRVLGGVAPSAIPAAAKGLLTAGRKGGAAHAAEVANLEAEGVRDLTAGQRTGSKPLQVLEQSLGDISGAGTRMVERGQEQFTRAALRRAGEDAPRATPDVIDGAFTRIGQQFDDLAARHTLQPDRAMGSQVRSAINDYNSIVAPPNRAPIIRAFEEEIAQVMGASGGRIPGPAYQSLRSRMDATARKAPPEVADTVREIKNALDHAMERHLQRINSPDLGAWRTARREYRNLLPIERAVTAAGSDAATGLISPSALRSAVVNRGRRGYARGTDDLGTLARSGEAVMKPYPQSGTAPRTFLSSTLPAGLGMMGTGFVTGNPALIAGGAATAGGPLLAGRALMSRPVQRWLASDRPYNYAPALSAPASLFDMQ